MGSIQLDLFLTLDGVAQAPGGPDEDPEGDFRFGGWQAPLIDVLTGTEVWAGMQGMDALLLGRKTYDIWADYWPSQSAKDGPDDMIAKLFNRIPKYVASETLIEPSWEGTTVLGPDFVAEVTAIRDRHEHTHVIGSLDLAQSLLAARLIDELELFVYPIILGGGKRLWRDGIAPSNLRLLEPAKTSPKGVVLLRYASERSEPATGDMASRDSKD